MRSGRSSAVMGLVGALFGAPGCGGDPARPAEAPQAGAAAQVMSVAKRWGDTVQEDGFLERDPHGVLQFRVVTARALSLGEGEAAALRVVREETFFTRLGEFHCKAQGELRGSAVYGWQDGEAEVRVSLAAGELPRSCKEPGFPVMSKALAASVMVLRLRSDRLIGKASARDRTVLLPLP